RGRILPSGRETGPATDRQRAGRRDRVSRGRPRRPRASRVCSVHQHGARAKGSSRDDRDAGCAGESPERWQASVKTMYRGALVLWLVSGFAIHAYFSRAAQGTAEVEQKRDLHLRQFENDDAVARQIRESHWNAESRMTLAYAGWALVGFALALRG